MIDIEFTSDHGDHAKGDTLRVDRVSAQVLVERDVAKIVAEAPAETVESGGERARELNQAAAAAEQGEQGEPDPTATAPAPPATEPVTDAPPAEAKAPTAPKGGRK